MRTRGIVVLALASLLLGGCAVRTSFQGCVIRCPDAMKDPDQIEAEGQRAVLESTPITGVLERDAAGERTDAMVNRLLSGLGVAVLSTACYPPAPSSACVEVGVGASAGTRMAGCRGRRRSRPSRRRIGRSASWHRRSRGCRARPRASMTAWRTSGRRCRIIR